MAVTGSCIPLLFALCFCLNTCMFQGIILNVFLLCAWNRTLIIRSAQFLNLCDSYHYNSVKTVNTNFLLSYRKFTSTSKGAQSNCMLKCKQRYPVNEPHKAQPFVSSSWISKNSLLTKQQNCCTHFLGASAC